MTLEQRLKLIISQLDELLKQLNGEPLTEQLPVYDAEWLNLIVGRYYPIYGVDNNGLVFNDAGDIGNYYLDPKASAGIILAALAKELNGDKVGDEYIVNHVSYGYGFSGVDANRSAEQVLFVDAQKAIDILSNFPEILPNYFKP